MHPHTHLQTRRPCPGPKRSTLALSLAAALLLAGCGGGSDSNNGSDARTASAAQAETRTYLGGQTRVSALALGSSNATPTLIVRARCTLAAGVGPIMQVYIDGALIGSVELRNTGDWADYSFSAPTLQPGSQVDVAFVNDAVISGEDRNLIVASISDGSATVLPNTPLVTLDMGNGAKAFDGLSVVAGRNEVWGNGALRMRWPTVAATDPDAQLRRQDAARFLQQATFGPTPGELDALGNQTYASWIDAQMALPVTDSYLAAVQARFDLGDAYRPGGNQYTPYEVSRAFWNTSFGAPDQLRRRVAYALHQILMVSQADGNLWHHSRTVAVYQDALNRRAFGNYRDLLQDIALSPAMGIYLSHMRNRKEDAATGRMPDENFAREVMQLFSIGLHELNPDGTPKLDATGRPIETYSNDDVMALAKVFTGFSWAFPDNELTESKFRWSGPSYTSASDTRLDVLPMRAYPGQHSSADKKLFEGKPWAVTLSGSADDDVRGALDALFNHPNVGPFIGRQLIQKLVTSEPSPAYVARISAVFADNGHGVRGDLGAVVKAILLDAEARGPAPAGFGKLREPVLRIAQWRRAFNALSINGAFNFTWDTDQAGQRALDAPSVFGDFRPGYVPPNSAFSARGATAPEFQIVNENTVAGWVNVAESMGSGGLGWTAGLREVAPDYGPLASKLMLGDVAGMLDDLDQLLFGATMSAELRRSIIEAIGTVGGNDLASQLNRARLAVFIALASPEYLVQR